MGTAKVASYVLASCFLIPPVASSANDEFDSVWLIKDAVKEIVTGEKGCGGWCITGACMHMEYKTIDMGFFDIDIPWTLIISPKFSHGNPETVVSVYPNVGNEPWYEWRETFGVAAAETTSTLIGDFVGLADEMTGNHGSQDGYGATQSTTYKDVDIIGHPLAAVLNNLNNDGSVKPNPADETETVFIWTRQNGQVGIPNPADTDDALLSCDHIQTTGNWWNPSYRFRCERLINMNATLDDLQDPDQQSGISGDAGTFLDSYGDTAEFSGQLESFFNDTLIYDAMNTADDVADNLKKLEQAVEITEGAMTTIEIASASSSSGVTAALDAFGVGLEYTVGNRVLCPTLTKPFIPYYLSYMDIPWRMGYPLADFDKTTTILNPFSSDRIGESSMTFSGFFNEPSTVPETWGHLYPRQGSLAQSSDSKASAVFATRAMHVLNNSVPNQTRIGIPLPGKPGSVLSLGSPKWQMIHPVEKSCRIDLYEPSSVSNPVDYIEADEEARYAWVYWRQYECCGNTKGEYLDSFDIIEICL